MAKMKRNDCVFKNASSRYLVVQCIVCPVAPGDIVGPRLVIIIGLERAGPKTAFISSHCHRMTRSNHPSTVINPGK